MHEFRIDPELHKTLKHIRESVRGMFEQLRLRSENGDISGKERLERVPALSKRNFGNLTNSDPQRAIKEAWRLIDFLEGSEEARLSLLARDGLRPVELDAHLARLRASARWQDTAARLRAALGAKQDSPEVLGVSAAPAVASDVPRTEPRMSGLSDDETRMQSRDEAQPLPARTPTSKSRTRLTAALLGIGVIGSSVILLATSRDDPADAHLACLPLETASDGELAARWSVQPGDPFPLPAPDPSRPDPVVLTISDPPGGPVNSIFTTSQFSYEGGRRPRREGGGRADLRLRVGGWGDTYLSLLKFPLPDDRMARRALIRLVVLGDELGSRPTAMNLRVIGDPWDVGPGPQDRLWWRDCPRSAIVRRGLPAPGTPGSHYDIDITHLYNSWVRGAGTNHGIMLEPEHIGSYGSSVERYSNFSTFYSTRAIDPANRPKLILQY